MIFAVEQKFIRKVNIRSGMELWRVKTRSSEVPSLVEGYAAAVYDSLRHAVYIPQGKMILGLRVDSGEPVWDTLPKLRGRAYQMQLAEQGLLVWGGPDPAKKSGHDYLTLVDLNTGKEIWSKAFTGLDHQKTSNFIVHQEHVWTYSKGKFWIVNLADGAATMTTNVLEFGEDEFWPSLEFRDSAFLVTGTNTIARLTVDGTPLFAATFKAPPPQFGMADVLTIVAVAASFASIVAVATSPTGGYLYYPTNIQSPPSPQATTRRSNYAYILTNVRDDTNRKPGMVKVNRFTRSPEAAVKLDDRSPRYTTDKNSLRLFYARKGHLVECYEF
jgi:outer membrane protein assembly factor BamB